MQIDKSIIEVVVIGAIMTFFVFKRAFKKEHEFGVKTFFFSGLGGIISTLCSIWLFRHIGGGSEADAWGRLALLIIFLGVAPVAFTLDLIAAAAAVSTLIRDPKAGVVCSGILICCTFIILNGFQDKPTTSKDDYPEERGMGIRERMAEEKMAGEEWAMENGINDPDKCTKGNDYFKIGCRKAASRH